jgi:guanylate kinase
MTSKQTHTVSKPAGHRGNSPTGRNGRLFIVSAPSGAGKTTLCRALRAKYPDLRYSVSYTTRPPRTGEQDGTDYHFISNQSFEAGIRSRRWAEWAQVHGHYYGTSAERIDAELSAGHDILLDIDVQGTLQLLDRYPDAITIFIMPPSLEILKNRLEARDTDSSETIARRLKAAKAEMAQSGRYRHVIVNDVLSEATDALNHLIGVYRQSSTPHTG